MGLKLLVEEGYEKEGQKVVLVSHSMGSVMLHYFLQQQSSEWKEKHIRCLVSLAGAWAGLARALKVFAVGDNMESWVVRAEDLVGEQRTDPSLAWLVPQKGFWSEDEVLVQTPMKNFVCMAARCQRQRSSCIPRARSRLNLLPGGRLDPLLSRGMVMAR